MKPEVCNVCNVCNATDATDITDSFLTMKTAIQRKVEQ